MIHLNTIKSVKSLALLCFLLVCLPSTIEAQRMGHRVSRGGGFGGGASMHRQAPQRNFERNRSQINNRQRNSVNRPATPNKSINGGHYISPERKITTSRVPNKSIDRNTGNKSKISNRNTKNNGNKIGNKTHIGNNNINVNINHRNTVVRPSYRPYTRPPYRYGGYGYYCHRPYFYHPYVPFYWGPYYHPWGYFITTLATTAIIVSIIDNDKDDDQEYHYDNGTYYLKTDKGFEAVQAPIGAQVPDIPKEADKVEVNNTTNYYYGGAFYEQNKDGYIVVPATAGTIVPNLPEGGEEVKIGDQTYVQFGKTYYQPIQVDGKNMYEIVEVKKES